MKKLEKKDTSPEEEGLQSPELNIKSSNFLSSAPIILGSSIPSSSSTVNPEDKGIQQRYGNTHRTEDENHHKTIDCTNEESKKVIISLSSSPSSFLDQHIRREKINSSYSATIGLRDSRPRSSIERRSGDRHYASSGVRSSTSMPSRVFDLSTNDILSGRPKSAFERRVTFRDRDQTSDYDST